MSDTSSKKHIEILSNSPFFSGVSSKSMEELHKNATEESYIKGEIIFKKGSIGDSMYVIINGKVKVFEKDHIYDTLTNGDCFGEYALIDNESRSASIATIEKTNVLKTTGRGTTKKQRNGECKKEACFQAERHSIE